MTLPEFLGVDGPAGIPGVAVGIVEENEDPKGLGRVKVQLRWREAEDESYWANIATTMAGGGRGTYFIPEKEDQVLVAFANEDIHHPFVIGSLWNQEDKPPVETPEGNDIRMIRSRSGHEILLNDADEGGRVEVTTNAGHGIVLDDADGAEQIAIEDKSGNEIVLDSGGDAIKISSKSTVSISAKSIEIASKGSINIEADGALNVNGSPINLN